MQQLIKKELLEDNDNYLIVHNGQIIEHSSTINNLIIDKNINVKIINIIDQDTKYEIIVKEGIDAIIEEIFYSIVNQPIIDIKLTAKKNAKVDFLTCKKTKENSRVNINVNNYLEENSFINYKCLSILSSEGEIKQNFYLDEPKSMLEIQSVIINTTGKKQNYETSIYHNEVETKSNMRNYGICNNNSLLNMYSDGIIKKGAKKAELTQKAKGLLLDLASNISANPLLEINDYDCLASHGASIGAIDDEELYYLMSRGLSKQESERLIISGFIYPFLKELPEGKLQDFLKSWININI